MDYVVSAMHALTATHATLLAKLADGTDPGAWGVFLDRYGDLIRAFCRRRGLQPADFEDVQQDVLLALTKSMPKFRYDPTKGLFRSYLKTVVMNAISRRLSQNVPAAGLSAVGASRVPDGDVGDDAEWEDEWRQHHLRQAMRVIEAEFSAKDRSAFEMYALEGRPIGEVAGELSMSHDAIYQAKSRITRRLAALIEAQVEEEG